FRCTDHDPIGHRLHGNAKAPVPRTDGDRALYFTCTPRTDRLGKWLPVGLPCPVPLQRSHFELLALDLPGPAGISPVRSSAIRSQDGPPCLLPISASFRDPSGSLTISMRLKRLNKQGRTTCSTSMPSNAQVASFTASPVMAGSGSTRVAYGFKSTDNLIALGLIRFGGQVACVDHAA